MNLAVLLEPASALVLVVDDDPDLLRLLSLRLRSNGYRVSTVDSAEAALAHVAVERPDLVLSDVRLPGRDGLALFDELRAHYPALPVILLTAHGTIPDAVAATARGVFGYLTKPFDSQALLAKIRQALTLSAAAGDRDDGNAWREEIVCRSRCMVELLEEARLVAASDASVLIHGESGSGKELLARAIHRASARAAKPFVAINCGAIPEALLESELFGHEKGAFTGATSRHSGLFQAAEGGTLFLDEIGDMPLPLQVKLLRVLQERRFRRLGGRNEQDVDVRVIAATNVDPAAAVKSGKLREDLYYRLNVFTIALPPLRDRKEDLPLLVQTFVEEFNQRDQKAVKAVDPEAMRRLEAYHWPGNVRELRNVIERAVILAKGDFIETKHLPPLSSERRPAAAPAAPGSEVMLTPGMTVDEAEQKLILATLDAASGNKTRAAEMLGISLKTLHNKLNRMKQGA